LAAALRAHAEGLYCLQAAVELLIGHRRWLCRDDFLGRFVGLVPETAGGGGVLAVVSWRAAVRALSSGRLPCAGSEGSVLRIAASIAGGVPVNLSECLSTLDESTIGLVVGAVLRAGGGTASWGVGAGWGERR
jgi:hypothetical protein